MQSHSLHMTRFGHMHLTDLCLTTINTCAKVTCLTLKRAIDNFGLANNRHCKCDTLLTYGSHLNGQRTCF